MDRSELIEQLIAWHEANEHQRIVACIESLPRKSWDFEISGLFSRALNNLDRYEDAMDQLFMFEEEGRENGVWNFRVGYSLYYLNREAEAAEYFKRAIQYGDDVEDTRELLKSAIFISKEKELLNKGIAILEAGERSAERIQILFDAVMIGIYYAREKVYGEDEEVKESIKNREYARMKYLIEYFDLNMEAEKLVRKLDGP